MPLPSLDIGQVTPFARDEIDSTMAAPCWKCGSRKADAVRYPRVIYWLAKALGYRLSRCGGCHRFRLVSRRSYDDQPTSLPVSEPKPQGQTGEPVTFRTPAVPRDPVTTPRLNSPNSCPRCGNPDYQRSPRTIAERRRRTGPMARCLACSFRYPLRDPKPA